MAKIYPFRAYRYTEKAGDPAALVTQPYDKIYPEMRARYLAASPYNLVRIILGERFPDDTAENNVYTRAAAHFDQWTQQGILERDAKPSLYAYFQRFQDPDTGEELTRKGLICAGRVEPYEAGIVHRHEQTLSGPKQDRRELLRHTEAHFGQIFLLYPDEAGSVDALLDQAAAGAPVLRVDDGYGALHLVWRVDGPEVIARIQALLEDKKLVIADGHHRYETALAFSAESPKADAQRVMMTLVNMHSPGLRILATHRMLHSLAGFDAAALISRLGTLGRLVALPGEPELKSAMREVAPDRVRVGVALPGAWHLLDVERTDGILDVNFLHEQVLGRTLGITEEDVREQKYLHYVRGLDAALEQVRAGQCQVAFLLQPTTVQQVAGISFGGGVMPQKSTDFFPKLLSGVTIYKLEK